MADTAPVENSTTENGFSVQMTTFEQTEFGLSQVVLFWQMPKCYCSIGRENGTVSCLIWQTDLVLRLFSSTLSKHLSEGILDPSMLHSHIYDLLCSTVLDYMAFYSVLS